MLLELPIEVLIFGILPNLIPPEKGLLELSSTCKTLRQIITEDKYCKYLLEIQLENRYYPFVNIKFNKYLKVFHIIEREAFLNFFHKRICFYLFLFYFNWKSYKPRPKNLYNFITTYRYKKHQINFFFYVKREKSNRQKKKEIKQEIQKQKEEQLQKTLTNLDIKYAFYRPDINETTKLSHIKNYLVYCEHHHRNWKSAYPYSTPKHPELKKYIKRLSNMPNKELERLLIRMSK